jgi:hypothetical protein
MRIKYFSLLSWLLFVGTLVLTSCLPPEDSATDDIDGSWSSFCEQTQPDSYYQDKVTFNALKNTVSSSSSSYSDANCLMIIEEISADVTWFHLGSVRITVSGLTAREIYGYETEDRLTPVSYSIYRIDGDLLYFGDSINIETTSTPENQPISLDFEFPLTRF